MPRKIRWLADVTPLRESPAYRRLWIGSTMSGIGSALTLYAVTLQVYEITRSPLAVGALGIAMMVPTLLVGLFAGPIVDAMDRRKLVLGASFCSAAISAVLAAQAFAGLDLVWLLYALVAVQWSVNAISGPARTTFVPSLLRPDQVPAGLALNRLTGQIMMTIGPALAGLIAAAPALGLRTCYLVDSISFVGSMYGVARLAAMRPAAGSVRPGPRAVAEGLGFIRRSQVLAGAFIADLTATFFGLPAALFPAINAERFGGDPRTLGLFMAAIGFGGLISGAFSGPVGHVLRPGRAMLCAVAVWGAAFAGFAVARSLWLTLACLALAGAADLFTVVFRGAIVLAVTPEQLRGRVSAVDYVVGAGGGHLGNLESGAVASLTTPVISALIGGLATVVGAIVIGLTMPRFAAYRNRPPSSPATDVQPETAAAEA